MLAQRKKLLDLIKVLSFQSLRKSNYAETKMKTFAIKIKDINRYKVIDIKWVNYLQKKKKFCVALLLD